MSREGRSPTAGSLTVVGTGIQLGTQLTAEGRAAIERADVVLCVAAEPAALAWLTTLNSNVRSLHEAYVVGRRRIEVYAVITDEVLDHVRRGLDVCFAVYGHPGMFVRPSHDALERAEREGFRTTLLAGISAEDCLFADLRVDPAETGWQSYEASGFLVRGRVPDPAVALVLWQVGVVGSDVVSDGVGAPALPQLVGLLLSAYPADHEVVVYEASPYAGFKPTIRRLSLGELKVEHVTTLSTLYVPPLPAGARV